MTPSPGQIWKDNDKRIDRYVRITGIGAEFVRMVRVNEDGTDYPKAYNTASRAARFREPGRNGFTFVRGQ